MGCGILRSRSTGREQLPKLLGIGMRSPVMLGRIVLVLIAYLPDKGIDLLVDVGEGANVLRNV